MSTALEASISTRDESVDGAGFAIWYSTRALIMDASFWVSVCRRTLCGVWIWAVTEGINGAVAGVSTSIL